MRPPAPASHGRVVPAFSLPLTITAACGDIDLLVELTEPCPLGRVLPDLLRRAGLPPATVLYLGIGPVDPGWVLGRAPLLAGAVLSSTPGTEPTVDAPVAVSCVAGPDAGRWSALPGTDSGLVIGRSDAADLSVGDPALSREHARLARREHRLTVTDLRSANGFRVDGRDPGRPDHLIGSGQLVRLGASLFRVTLTAEPTMMMDPDGRGGLRVARPARLLRPFRMELPPEPGPPPEPVRRPLPLLAALLGGVAGVAIALVTGMWMFLLLAGLGPVMMVGTAVGDRVSGRRGHRRLLAEHRAAVAAEEKALAEAAEADRLDAWDRYPDPATLLRRARSPAARLWERRPTDPDFLRLSIGVGSRPARVARRIPPPVAEAPLTIGLGQLGVLGLAGRCRSVLRALLAAAAALHAPSDLRIVVLSDDPGLRPLRHLEHTGAPGRFGEVVADEDRAQQVLRELVEELAGPGPPVLLVLDGAHRWRRLPAARQLLQVAAQPADPDAGLVEPMTGAGGSIGSRLTVLCADCTSQALPIECRAVASVTADRVTVATGTSTLTAEPIGVSQAYLAELCRALAPLRDPDRAGGSLPSAVVLSDLRADAPAEPDWARPRLSARLGLAADGIVECRLEHDGPHVLIAGTTGSGKSELLLTLVAGLALAAPPDHTQFLLVDYKGGAAFRELTDLPHTTGVLTDLDQDLAARALTSLRAEVRRRETVLHRAGAADLQTLRERGPGPFGSLVIVVDEFATLAAELPDFLTGLLDVAQRGRSLGLHLVLATQRPAGVLSPAIRANIGVRICLRVTDPADSLDVIDSPEAARLPRTVPGRAILRAGAAPVLFQTARVTATDAPASSVRLRDAPAISSLGTRDGPSDLMRVVGRCRELAAQRFAAGASPPRPVWLPPLPTRIRDRDLPALLPDLAPDPSEASSPDASGALVPGTVPGQISGQVLAVADRPATASRVAVPATGSVLIAGSPGSGRTTALRRIAHCAARDGAELVVLDAGGVLGELRDWSCCGTMLDGRDPQLVQRVVELLHAELTARAGRPGPSIQVLIDDWEAVTGPLDLTTFGAGPTQLAEVAGRGPAVGIQVAATGDQRLRHHRCAAAFGTTLLLGADPDQPRPTGEPIPGRGRCGQDQVQVVDAGPGAGRPPAGSRPRLVVRELPAMVGRARLPPATERAVPIGLGGDDASPVTVDLAGPGGGFLVAGPRRSGVSTALRTIARGAAEAGIRTLRVLPRPEPSLPGVEDHLCGAGEVDGRSELWQALDGHDGPLALVVDELTDDHPEANLLHAYLVAAGVGHQLIAGCRLDQAGRSFRGLVGEIAAFRTGVLLQADAPDGAVLDAALPRRRGPGQAGRGHLVVLGQVTPLQLAGPDRCEQRAVG